MLIFMFYSKILVSYASILLHFAWHLLVIWEFNTSKCPGRLKTENMNTRGQFVLFWGFF